MQLQSFSQALVWDTAYSIMKLSLTRHFYHSKVSPCSVQWNQQFSIALIYVAPPRYLFALRTLNMQGVLCLGVLKRSRQQKAISREQATKDLEELEKRREELEALLLAERSELVWWQRSNVFAQCRLIVAPADSIPLVHPRRSVTRNHFRWCASFSCFWFSSRFLLNWVSGVSILRGYIDRLGLSRVSVVRFMSMW